VSAETTTIADTVEGRLCCGCGACAVACEAGAVTLVEGPNYNYPRIDPGRCRRMRRVSTWPGPRALISGKAVLPGVW
jgi:ferredoxin